ncbi:hypothetical protein BGZ94_010183 [Podila epigama]|nr:hypothetical protein BGZ94_010183 [Podila epigama]
MPPYQPRGEAMAIPLVTISLASGHLHQTRLANMSTLEQDTLSNSDPPPAYDSLTLTSTTTTTTSSDSAQAQDNNQNALVNLATPSNADLTDAVLHLSRTLVSSAKSIPPPPTSSWFFMMLYNWTHTQRTATQLYHIITQPVNILKELRLQHQQQQQLQQKKSRKSIQQQTEEQDMMEDDPDMLNGTATEMMPVSMLNTRKVLHNDDVTISRSRRGDKVDDGRLDHHDGMHLDYDGADNTLETRNKRRKQPRRRIERYRNPFGSNVRSDDELEDDEGWLGRGEACSEYGQTKTNSVRLTSTARHLAIAQHRKPIDFTSPSSLAMAMDPNQFHMDYTPQQQQQQQSRPTNVVPTHHPRNANSSDSSIVSSRSRSSSRSEPQSHFSSWADSPFNNPSSARHSISSPNPSSSSSSFPSSSSPSITTTTSTSTALAMDTSSSFAPSITSFSTPYSSASSPASAPSLSPSLSSSSSSLAEDYESFRSLTPSTHSLSATTETDAFSDALSEALSEAHSEAHAEAQSDTHSETHSEAQSEVSLDTETTSQPLDSGHHSPSDDIDHATSQTTHKDLKQTVPEPVQQVHNNAIASTSTAMMESYSTSAITTLSSSSIALCTESGAIS